MNQAMSHLNELIEITRDGQHFYRHALQHVSDADLQHLFRDMAQSKTHIIQALSVKVAASHEQPSQSGTTAGRMREMYADAKARLGHPNAVYIEQLDHAEERMLEAFEDALKTAEPDVRALLAVELPKIRACHARIHELNEQNRHRH